MLFDVAALFTSVALGPVAEAFGVHENSQQIVATTTFDGAPVTYHAPLPAVRPDAIPDAPPLPFIGPEPTTNPIERVQGTRLLQQISLVPANDIPLFVQANATELTALVATPPAATEVTSWWNSLGYESRTALRTATPEVVGNLDGIPYTVRDLANRDVLDETMAHLERVITAENGRTVVENAKRQLKMLTSISDSLGPKTAGRTLMSLDVTGQGRAAIVLGDLRTADYVSYLVPGMFFTIENQMGDWVDAAARLHDEQLSWLALLGDSRSEGTGTSEAAAADSSDAPDADSTDADTTVATVAWIGYPTPNLINVGGLENAYEGRDSLAGAITGLQSLRADDEPYVTVIAHSYGSTAALMALTEDDFEIDALAMVGSPGSPAKSVDELHVRDANVWVGEAAWDPIPNSSYFGSDPGSESYGAKKMGVSGTTDSITHQVLTASFGHNEYFSPGTESMRNFALIGIGRGELVTNGTEPLTTKAHALGR